MKIKRIPKEINKKLVRDFSHIVKQMREECGLSQQELAEMVGFETGVAISLVESGKRGVSVTKLWQIACVCDWEINLTPKTNDR